MPKIILVTGASAGIGQACADRLHQQGLTVIGASRRGTSSSGWTPLVMDVDDDQSVQHGVASTVETHGRIDGVVTCAGWGLSGPVEQTPIADAKAQMETNLWGTVRVVQQVLPIMRRQQQGRLVLVSSIGGMIGIPFQAFYSATKFAVEGYGEALAYEVAPFGIGVTLIEPGNVRTDFTSSRRQVQSDSEHDPYGPAVEKAVGLMEHDEQHGVDPLLVATAVERAITTKHPPRRISVGKFDERVGIMGKRLMPFRLFERAAKSSLGV